MDNGYIYMVKTNGYMKVGFSEQTNCGRMSDYKDRDIYAIIKTGTAHAVEKRIHAQLRKENFVVQKGKEYYMIENIDRMLAIIWSHRMPIQDPHSDLFNDNTHDEVIFSSPRTMDNGDHAFYDESTDIKNVRHSTKFINTLVKNGGDHMRRIIGGISHYYEVSTSTDELESLSTLQSLSNADYYDFRNVVDMVVDYITAFRRTKKEDGKRLMYKVVEEHGSYNKVSTRGYVYGLRLRDKYILPWDIKMPTYFLDDMKSSTNYELETPDPIEAGRIAEYVRSSGRFRLVDYGHERAGWSCTDDLRLQLNLDRAVTDSTVFLAYYMLGAIIKSVEWYSIPVVNIEHLPFVNALTYGDAKKKIKDSTCENELIHFKVRLVKVMEGADYFRVLYMMYNKPLPENRTLTICTRSFKCSFAGIKMVKTQLSDIFVARDDIDGGVFEGDACMVKVTFNQLCDLCID
jgi:hypothetical protein